MLREKINRFQCLVDTIPGILNKIFEEEFSFKPNENKWSKKEILGHLIDSATNNHHRFIRAQYENFPVISYNQNEWNRCGYHQKISIMHLIEFWGVYNKHLLELIQLIPEEKLQLKCYVDFNETKTLEKIFEDYIIHLEHHLKQIVGEEKF